MKSRCPVNPAVDGLSHFSSGTYCPACAEFDERRFAQDCHFYYFLVFGFLRRFIRRDYHALRGDPVLGMVASEIWLYNIGRLLSKNDVTAVSAHLNDESRRREMLPRCNSYSVSQALDLPPETVRRKVKKLIDMGWVHKDGKGELAITAMCEEAFRLEFNLETMRDFVSTARFVFAQLGLQVPAPAES